MQPITILIFEGAKISVPEIPVVIDILISGLNFGLEGEPEAGGIYTYMLPSVSL